MGNDIPKKEHLPTDTSTEAPPKMNNSSPYIDKNCLVKNNFKIKETMITRIEGSFGKLLGSISFTTKNYFSFRVVRTKEGRM